MTQIEFNKNLIQPIIKGLDSIPPNWRLTPMQNGKQAYRPGWQKSGGVGRNELKRILQHGDRVPWGRVNPTGYGLLTGDCGNNTYLIAIDLDGENAHNLEKAILGDNSPITVGWTSGKPHREQKLYRLSDRQYEQIKELENRVNKPFTRLVISQWDDIEVKVDKDGKQEQLEIRGNKSQSVLPPSWHPETGGYQWTNSPMSEVAELPHQYFEIIIKQLCKEIEAERQRRENAERARQQRAEYLSSLGDEFNEDDLIRQALSHIDPDCEYETWIRVLMALHSHGDYWVHEADNWSKGSAKYKPGEVERKWRSFGTSTITIGTLFTLAKQYGFCFPQRERNTNWGEPEAEAYRDYCQSLEDEIEHEVEYEYDRIIHNQAKLLEKIQGSKQDNVNPEVVTHNPDVDFWYKEGEMLSAIAKAKELAIARQAHKPVEERTAPNVLVISGTGTGKSFQAKSIGGAIHINNDAKNLGPDYDHIATLMPRHGGLAHDEGRRKENGEPYLTQMKRDDAREIVIPANCINTDTFNQLERIGLKGEVSGKEGLVCGACPKYFECKGKEDEEISDEINFIGQRRHILSSTTFKAHIQSLPRDSYDYSQKTAVVDEAKEVLRNCIKSRVINNDGFMRWYTKAKQMVANDLVLAMVGDELLTNIELNQILDDLNIFISGLLSVESYESRYGSHEEIQKLVIEYANQSDGYRERLLLALIAIESAMSQEVTAIVEELDSVTLADNRGAGLNGAQTARIRSAYQAEKRRERRRFLAEYPSIDLLTQLFKTFLVNKDDGDRYGFAQKFYCTFKRGEVTMVAKDMELINILKQTGLTVYMDATMSKTELAAFLDVPESEIVVICQEPKPTENLTLLRVELNGDTSNNFTPRFRERLTNLIKQVKMFDDDFVAIAPKSIYEEVGADAYDLGQTRGSNRFSGNNLLLSPVKLDIGAIKSEYYLLNLESRGMTFKQYYEKCMTDNIIQGIGRTRYVRYPDRHFTVILPLPKQIKAEAFWSRGLPVVDANVADFCPEAAPKRQQNLSSIKRGLVQILEDGVKLTQTTLAKVAGLSRSAVTRIVQSNWSCFTQMFGKLQKLSGFLKELLIQKRTFLKCKTNWQENESFKMFAHYLSPEGVRTEPTMIFDLCLELFEIGLDGIEFLACFPYELLLMIKEAVVNAIAAIVDGGFMLEPAMAGNAPDIKKMKIVFTQFAKKADFSEVDLADSDDDDGGDDPDDDDDDNDPDTNPPDEAIKLPHDAIEASIAKKEIEDEEKNQKGLNGTEQLQVNPKMQGKKIRQNETKLMNGIPEGTRCHSKFNSDKIGNLFWCDRNAHWGIIFDDGTSDLFYPEQIVVAEVE